MHLSYSQANSVFRCRISTALKLSLTCSARHSLMSILVLVDLTLWLVRYNCDECTHVPPFDNICSVMIDWRTSTLTLSTTRTFSELLHAVGLLCTRVTVTVVVYFERVCVCVFLSTGHSLFSLDFIACFLLAILCLVAIPTEVSASSHLLNGWQCFITHSLKSLVLQSLKPRPIVYQSNSYCGGLFWTSLCVCFCSLRVYFLFYCLFSLTRLCLVVIPTANSHLLNVDHSAEFLLKSRWNKTFLADIRISRIYAETRKFG